MNVYHLFGVLLIVVGIYLAESAPLDAYENNGQLIETERADRHRRLTCDLLSIGGKVNDSACAANCLSMGKAGGRCNKGVCQCRKTKIGDLWKKRFGH